VPDCIVFKGLVLKPGRSGTRASHVVVAATESQATVRDDALFDQYFDVDEGLFRIAWSVIATCAACLQSVTSYRLMRSSI
jgi:hypothetical protein